MNTKSHPPLKYSLFAFLMLLAACTAGSAPLSSRNTGSLCNLNVPACIVVAGYAGNSVAAGIKNATISGGGLIGLPNHVSGEGGTVGGGMGNTAGEGSTVSGGSSNTALYFDAAVGGGTGNLAAAEEAAVAGGFKLAVGRFSVVAGGGTNLAGADFSTVAGGSGNISNYQFSAVGGGTGNVASNEATVVSGGEHNLAQGSYSAILGGVNNLSGSPGAVVSGGAGNVAVGSYSVIPGGFSNQAGGDYSFAAGRRAMVKTGDPGVFLFADASNFPFPSVAPDEFAVRATGGVRFVTALDSSGDPLSGVRLSPGSGSWESLSDVNSKAGFADVDGTQVLNALMSVPISTWYYRGQDASIRHIGPMAQDFYSAFQLGTDNRYISTVDEEGVALAAIQQLYRLVRQGGTDAQGSPELSTTITRVASLQRQLNFSNALSVVSVMIAVLALWQRKNRKV